MYVLPEGRLPDRQTSNTASGADLYHVKTVAGRMTNIVSRVAEPKGPLGYATNVYDSFMYP